MAQGCSRRPFIFRFKYCSILGHSRGQFILALLGSLDPWIPGFLKPWIHGFLVLRARPSVRLGHRGEGLKIEKYWKWKIKSFGCSRSPPFSHFQYFSILGPSREHPDLAFDPGINLVLDPGISGSCPSSSPSSSTSSSSPAPAPAPAPVTY